MSHIRRRHTQIKKHKRLSRRKRNICTHIIINRSFTPQHINYNSKPSDVVLSPYFCLSQQRINKAIQYICINIHIHTCNLSTQMYMYVYIYVYIYIDVHTYTNKFTYMYTYIHTYNLFIAHIPLCIMADLLSALPEHNGGKLLANI